MHIYDIAVVGAGPAGIMAAVRAGQLKKDVVLVERNDTLGRKLLLTGKGRCNITNAAPLDTFIKKFDNRGEFLRTAFLAFFNNDLVGFFKAKGLGLKTERQGRIFPETDKASSVIKVLAEYLSDNKVVLLSKMRLTAIKGDDDNFELAFEDKSRIRAKKVILATGGASYKATGSSGDGFRIAEGLGHTVAPLTAVLVPLKAKESWVKNLQGLSLENIRITFTCGKKKIVSEVGEAIFTHFGVSGPLILDLSGDIVSILGGHREVRLLIDLKPGLTPEQLDKRLLNEFKQKGNVQLNNIFKGLLPYRLIPVFLRLADLASDRRANQVTQRERRSMIHLLKAFPLTVIAPLALEEAMVTGGGISTKEIDPRTMESRLVPGLYFAGEIIDGAAPSGGYNLQQAFSTGHLAGERAALCVK